MPRTRRSRPIDDQLARLTQAFAEQVDLIVRRSLAEEIARALIGQEMRPKRAAPKRRGPKDAPKGGKRKRAAGRAKRRRRARAKKSQS